MADFYKCLKTQSYSSGSYSIVPIRMEDRYEIMKWRNEQIYHLRQNEILTKEEQDNYFDRVVSGLFNADKPNQVLFSYLRDTQCIGYGGLVHINWIDQNAEISFIMDTSLENDFFVMHWDNFLKMIERVAFLELKFHKIFTFAFDLRPKVYVVLEESGFGEEARLQRHVLHRGEFIDVVIHSKFNLKYE